MEVEEFDSPAEANNYCKTFIIDAAKETIPKTTGLESDYRSVWWNDECTEVKHNRSRDWKCYKNKVISKTEFNRTKAKARQVFNRNKRKKKVLSEMSLIIRTVQASAAWF